MSFRVDIVYGASEGYSVRQAKSISRPVHITGATLMVDVSADDFSQIATAGPFTWVDAILYAEHAQGLETFEDAIKFLLDIERSDDWTGLLAPLQPA